MLQNVRLLKWCAEFSITPLWNFLYGFPGENAQEHDETSCLIPSLPHLMPQAASARSGSTAAVLTTPRQATTGFVIFVPCVLTNSFTLLFPHKTA